MSKCQRSFRLTAVRFAVVAAIGLSFLTFTVIGANAAGNSFFDSVKEFFGLQASSASADKKEQPLAAFTAGNLVVVQMGDGVAALTGASAQASLLEFTTAGSPVQTITVNSTGSSPRLTLTGTSTSEGHLVRSSDGSYLTLTGYDVIAGTPTGFANATTPRVIGRIDSAGTVDLTTAFTDGGTGAVRSAASTNGTDMWMTNSAVGLRYGTFGSNAVSTQVTTTPTNTRVVKIFNGQLYMTSGSGGFTCVNTVGTGTPTGTGNTTANLPGMTCSSRSPYSFSISPAGETMYVADDGLAASNGGIQKWELSAGVWSNTYTLLLVAGVTTPVRGLTVDWSGANPIIYATTNSGGPTVPNTLISVTDTGSGSTATTLATSPANTLFRGVDFAPVSGGPTPTATNSATASPSPTFTFTPTNTPAETPTFTNTSTPTNTATNTATATPTQTPPTGPTFVISQVYGGGGGTGTYMHDYVEIKNITASVQSLNLLKLYYGSALGVFASSSANEFILPNVSLNPGQFYLVQLGTAGTGLPLPVAPDAISATMNLSASSGKVALVTGLLPINTCGSTATPCDATQLSYIVDWVAYGAAGNGAVNVGENGNPSVNNGVAITNADGGVRQQAGCKDTNDNNADFDVTTPPIPRNTSITFACGGTSPTPTITNTATDTPTGTPSSTLTATETGTATNTATPTPTQTPPTGPTFVLSQVYGGGGATSGTPAYVNDYVEIKNITASPQSLHLLKLYYGSALGNFASFAGSEFALPNVSLNPGQFYLVQLGTNGTVGAALPVTPDVMTSNINMSATSGKIALVTGLLDPNVCGSTATPCDATQLSYIVDWVAYGAAGNGTAGNGEGGTTVNNGVAITNADGGVRKLNGCQDTNNNNADFDVVTPPVPRNTSTTAACVVPSGSVAGTITYGNAINNPPAPRFVKNVSLSSTLGAPPVGPIVTGTPGTYTLTGFGAGAYTIRPTKTGGPNTSISSNDAARVAQGASGAVAFASQNQRFVSDTTGNGAVSSQDAAKIAQFVAGLPSVPPNLTGQWRFFVTGAPSPLPTAPQTYNDSRSYPGPITTALTGEDYIGLLIGEASGNWNPAVHPRTALGPERSTTVEAPRLVTPADNEVIVPISVQGAADKEIISYEFDLRYDPAVIQPQANPVDLIGTVSRGLMAVANPNEPGLLRVVIYGVYPIDQNGLLLNLRFNAVGAPGSTSPLTFENMMFNEGDPGTIVTDGMVQLSAAPANQAEITGRLLSPTGEGIPNARVTLTDTTGKTTNAVSNGFGAYRFGGLTVGQTYTVTASSKHHAFAPLTASVTSQSVNLDLIAGQ